MIPAWRLKVDEGAGLSLIESGWTTDALALPDREGDSSYSDRFAVSVEYDVVAGELVAGHYWFDRTMTTGRADILVTELNLRYGEPVTTTERRITWIKNGDTEVYINLPGENGGGCLHYYSLDHKDKTAEARQYNRLPIRVVVPDGA